MKLIAVALLFSGLSLRGNMPEKGPQIGPPVEAPKLVEAPKAIDLAEKPRFAVQVSAQGNYSIKGVSLSLKQIEAVLRQVRELSPEIVLLIDGDKGVDFRCCRELIRTAANCEINQVIFQSKQDKKPKKVPEKQP